MLSMCRHASSVARLGHTASVRPINAFVGACLVKQRFRLALQHIPSSPRAERSGGLQVSKLHSFLILFFFLICGLLACEDTENAANEPGLVRSDAAVGTQTDGASARDAAAASVDAAASTRDSLRADASSSGAADAAAGAASREDAGVSEPAGEAAYGSFSHIYEVAFRTCRTQCHLMGYSMLNMATRESAYAALVDQASNPRNMECAPLGLKRVVPGAPDESLLYLKLDINAPCGQQIPPGGTLTQELRDEVRDWIANGAKDN